MEIFTNSLLRKILQGGYLVISTFALLTTFFLAGANCQAATDKPQFALMVGINKYPDDIGALRGCENDVKDIRVSLVKNYSFIDDKAHFRTLTDEQATHDGIVSNFRQFLLANAKKNPGARVLFFYSGHGASLPDISGDENDGFDEAIVPVDANKVTATRLHSYLLDDELEKLYIELTKYTTNVTFIFDACHSATATRAPETNGVQRQICQTQLGINQGIGIARQKSSYRKPQKGYSRKCGVSYGIQ